MRALPATSARLFCLSLLYPFVSLLLGLPSQGAAQGFGTLAIGSVEVTPDGSTTFVHQANTAGYAQTFLVKNNYDRSVTYDITCFGRNNVTCTGTDLTEVTLGAGGVIDVTAYYNVGALHTKARLVLKASGAAQDTGYYFIPIANPAPPTIGLRNHNGDNRDRSLCLTSGAGEAAAWQCGDLLVTHSLPGYATMGRERGLTLLYNSAQAVPKPVVVAAVKQGSLAPSAVIAYLTVNGATDTVSYNGWASGTRQIALPYDAIADSSGIYPFTLTVRNVFSGSVQDATLSDTLLVVNRASSLYGRGWSLAGVEELRLNQPGNKILWVGGDGSAKVYRSVATNTWQAVAGAYRDTLIQFDSASVTWWRRTLRHGIKVTYRVTGSANQAKHVRTTNRVEHSTLFTWSGDTLKTIIVPPHAASNTTYTLAFASGRIDRITDPAGRVLDVTVTNNRLTQIVDPDTAAYHTDFIYDVSGRMTGRTTRRGHTTTFTYTNGLRVTKVTIPVGRTTGDTVTSATTFFPWDEKGLAVGSSGQVAVDTALARTKVDGPRLSPVADTALFWIDRWGAPTKTVDPIGATTTVQRLNPLLPALVTQIRYPLQRILTLSWNNRGNLTQTRDSTWHLPDSLRRQTAVRVWTYPTDPMKQDSPDTTADSTETSRIITRFTYNTLGLTDSVIAPNGHVTRFFTRTSAIDPLRGMIDSVVERHVPTWDTTSKTEPLSHLSTRFVYNALGNLIRAVSPSGRVDSLWRDQAQRVIDVKDPAGHRTELVYDPLNRLLQSIRHVNDSAFSGTLVTRQHYAIDVLDSVIDPRGVVRSYGYDFAGRRVVEIDDYGKRDSIYYDRAGLIDSIRPRFYQDSAGRAVRHQYDAAGRLIKKSWPARDIAADSVVTTYDAEGRFVTAKQSNRQVVRTYYSNGLIRSERQSHPNNSLLVSLFYSYDRLGRRTWYRSGTAGDNAQRDSIWYTYDATTGDLSKINVRWRGSVAPLDSVRLKWDTLGRRDLVIYSNGLSVKFAYDADGAQRLVCGTHAGGNEYDVFDFTRYHRTVDAEGLVLNTWVDGTGIAGCGDNLLQTSQEDMVYDSRHQLLSHEIGGLTTTYRYDRSGNMIVRKEGSSVDHRYYIDSLHNRLRMYYNAAFFQIDDSMSVWYDRSGNRLTNAPYSNGTLYTPPGSGYREYWYDGLGRQTGTSEYACVAAIGDEEGPGSSCEYLNMVEAPDSCRYDPLGRLYYACQDGVGHVGYDGNNVVRIGGDIASDEWSFVHGPGVDDPLMAFRNNPTPSNWDYLYFVTDGFGGQLAVGTNGGGNATTTPPYRDGGRLAGGARFSESFYSSRHSNPGMYQLSFFRNRFYDQATGRWTQEDPIGVAGGINLYQFNGNNPIAYTDPFGLCPENMKESKKECDKWNAARALDVRAYYDKQHAAGNPGTRLVQYSLDRQPIRGVSGSDINAIGNCPATTVTGCTRPGQEMVINVDRPIPAAATTVAHENVHSAGFSQEWEGMAQAVARVFMVNLPTPDRLTAEVAGAGPRPTHLIVPWLLRPF